MLLRLQVAAALLVPGLAFGQASFPTPNGQQVPGTMMLVPCGAIVNGQTAGCAPGAVNPLQVVVTNATSPTGVIEAASNPTNGTISVTNTFQLLLAQNSTRRACAFQNQGAHLMYFSIQSTPTEAGSWQVLPGNTWKCPVGVNGVTRTDAINVTGTAGDAYSGDWQ